MFEGFIQLTEKIEISSQTVSFMHLWYNQTFKIGGNSFFFKNLLSKMGLKEHDYCSFCNQYPKTIAHLFWDCTHVDIFWRSFKTWLTNDFNNDVFCNWSNIEIILGNRKTQKDSSIITLFMKCKMNLLNYI